MTYQEAKQLEQEIRLHAAIQNSEIKQISDGPGGESNSFLITVHVESARSPVDRFVVKTREDWEERRKLI